MAALDPFSPATRAWFEGAFREPTPAQAGAWEAISSGRHALVVAPTGSGKTLSAFLWSLDRLFTDPRRHPSEHGSSARTRVLYISPLKALGVDVERNLRAPLVGITQTAARLGTTAPSIRIGVRSGDTTAADRRLLLREPPDILITTPESLYLMLTSSAGETLAGVETVIVDEIHAVAATKRGAHLAVSLERLDALLDRPAQRIGLSATVRPVEEVARFLGGRAPVAIVKPPIEKTFDLRVVVPVEDMTELGARAVAPGGEAVSPGRRMELEPGEAALQSAGSIWPHVDRAIMEEILRHRSTIVFANSRRLAERLTASLNELYASEPVEATVVSDRRRSDADDRPGRRFPAQAPGASGITTGAEPVLARAHHGSVSKEQRAMIEDDLKSGRLRCVVATSSLELGIDMGAVDLVIQVESPPSVASGLQRVGRAGHQVGEISKGVLFPKHRADLLHATVVSERMTAGLIEAIAIPQNPLDILAQQTVAAAALAGSRGRSVDVEEWFDTVRRSAPFATLPRSAFDATLDLLAGRYPSDEFAELRPRIVWDRVAGTIVGRPGSQRLAITSGGTIPDRGMFGVFIVGTEDGARRVGELDEEMVYESRVGDVFALGATSWRIEEITSDRVLVSPAFGQPGRVPFWKGDGLGRPAELGRAIGAFTGALDLKATPSSGRRRDASADARPGRRVPDAMLERLRSAGLDEYAVTNLQRFVAEQQEATGAVPTDTTLVVERFRDELGDWRLVLHSPYGMPVHAPWALAVGARIRERLGVEGSAMAGDDGIVVRLPETDAEPPGADLFLFEPQELDELVTLEVGGSALFASRFRESAGRALLLPRMNPTRRSPLWQQRQRSAQLLEVARKYPGFPIILETVREVLQDVYDLPSLDALARELASNRVRMIEVETDVPSPFARTLLFGYVAAFLYEGDSPLAERRAAALSLDPALLAELLGRAELRELLDPKVIEQTELELQRLAPDRRARDAEGLVDLLRILGPLRTPELAARYAVPAPAAPDPDPLKAPIGPVEGSATTNRDLSRMLAELEELVRANRVLRVSIAGEERWAVVEDASRLRDALGVPLPIGVPTAFLEPVADPVGDLVSRYVRTHGPFTAADAAARLGLGVAVVTDALRRLAADRRAVEGEFRPGATGSEWVDAEILRRLRARSLAALRSEVEPVPQRALGRFLPDWQHVGAVELGAEAISGLRRDPSAEGRPGPRSSAPGSWASSSSAPRSMIPQWSTPSSTSSSSPPSSSPPSPARRSSAARSPAPRFTAPRPGLRGIDGLIAAIDQLGGVALPASAWESLILPSRVRDFAPAMLDELTTTGEVLWSGRGELPGGDGWVALHLADTAPLTLPLPSPVEPPAARSVDSAAEPGPAEPATAGPTPAEPATAEPTPADATELHDRVLLALTGGGAFFFRQLQQSLASGGPADDPDLARALWDLVWAGVVSNDTLAPLRARLGATSHRGGRPTRRPGRPSARTARRRPETAYAPSSSAPTVAGRWSLLPQPETATTVRAAALAEQLLDRHGIVTRGAVQSEAVAGGFALAYKVLAGLEETGRTRRGYFVEGLGAAQFATPATVDRVRAFAPEPEDDDPPVAITLAATDPANPYGAALPWPSAPTEDGSRHRPGRKAGALVVLVDGGLALYVERGGRTVLDLLPRDDADRTAALRAAAATSLARTVRATGGRLRIERVDGAFAMGTPLGDALIEAGFAATPQGLRLRG